VNEAQDKETTMATMQPMTREMGAVDPFADQAEAIRTAAYPRLLEELAKLETAPPGEEVRPETLARARRVVEAVPALTDPDLWIRDGKRPAVLLINAIDRYLSRRK
jgi:hypothetical protein